MNEWKQTSQMFGAQKYWIYYTIHIVLNFKRCLCCFLWVFFGKIKKANRQSTNSLFCWFIIMGHICIGQVVSQILNINNFDSLHFCWSKTWVDFKNYWRRERFKAWQFLCRIFIILGGLRRLSIHMSDYFVV